MCSAKTRVTVTGPKIGQGRPLVFLVAWLCSAPLTLSPAEHKLWVPTDEDRFAARRQLEAIPESVGLRGVERDPLDAEGGSEPPVFQL